MFLFFKITILFFALNALFVLRISGIKLPFKMRTNGSDVESMFDKIRYKLLTDDHRIVRGQMTTILHYPFIVSIQIWRDLKWQHTCGGSIIGDSWILTAGHCVGDKTSGKMYSPSWIAVLLGYTNIQRVRDTKNYRLVQKVWRHPKYDPKMLKNDIAILKLKDPLQLSKDETRFRAITLADRKTLPKNAKDRYKNCIALGWGYTVYQGQLSDVLRVVKLPVLDQDVCNRMVYQGTYLTSNQLCTYDETYLSDTCQGDSGGPLVCDNVQVGITSWGHGCGWRNKAAVLTRVESFRDWIKYIQENEPSSATKPFGHFSQVILISCILYNLR